MGGWEIIINKKKIKKIKNTFNFESTQPTSSQIRKARDLYFKVKAAWKGNLFEGIFPYLFSVTSSVTPCDLEFMLGSTVSSKNMHTSHLSQSNRMLHLFSLFLIRSCFLAKGHR